MKSLLGNDVRFLQIHLEIERGNMIHELYSLVIVPLCPDKSLTTLTEVNCDFLKISLRCILQSVSENSRFQISKYPSRVPPSLTKRKSLPPSLNQPNLNSPSHFH